MDKDQICFAFIKNCREKTFSHLALTCKILVRRKNYYVLFIAIEFWYQFPVIILFLKISILLLQLMNNALAYVDG